MQNPLVLSLDLGTQSIRALLVDSKGSIVAKTQHPFERPYYSQRPGWAEQDPYVYWRGACDVCLRLKQENAERWGDIIAVTLTTIRDTAVCVDENGEPLRDAIVWLDKREAANTPLPARVKLLTSLIGMSDTMSLQQRVSACNWIMQNQPEIWEKTHKYIMISGFLTHKLTGSLVDSVANMIGHIPLNSKTRNWMKRGELVRCVFDIEAEKLPDICEPGETIGRITEKASELTGIPAGLPFIAAGSDKGCETLGLGCITPDRAAICLGTTATVQFTIDRYMEPLPFIPAFPAVIKGHYNPESQVYRGYWLVSWFKKEFAAHEVLQAAQLGVSPESLLNSRLSEIPPGCEGLIFQPYFTPGVVMPKARGAIIGFSDAHTRLHIYRAIIEGINFALYDGLVTMEKRGGVKIEKLYIAGGGSQSDEICIITANMFGRPVCKIQTFEAAGLGSAIIAFAAMGIYGSIQQAVKNMVHTEMEFTPNMQENALYMGIYSKVYKKVFPRLLPLYKLPVFGKY